MGGSNRQIEIAVSLQSIQKSYQNQTVLHNIDLEIHSGEFVSLLGPSGSGKTTLLRMIAGLVSPDGGSIILKGQDVGRVPPNQRNLGMVFQQYALFPHMTVWENVAFGLVARKMSKNIIKERVQKYLAYMGLSHLSARKPKELSGGQQQRVSLARSLAVEPVLLLFDEPLSNLDIRLKEQLLQEIHRLHKELGFTAVYVTHDQNEALYLSDKIAVLNQGHIEQLAEPAEIIGRPATPFVADFCGYTSRFAGAVLTSRKTARLDDLEIPLVHVAEGTADGARGSVMLRPNAIKICRVGANNYTAADPATPLLAVEISDCRYRNGQSELSLRLPQGGGLSAKAIFPDMLNPMPAERTAAQIQFSSTGIAFFPEDGKRHNVAIAGENQDHTPVEAAGS